MNTNPETAKRKLFDAMQDYLAQRITGADFTAQADYLLRVINPQLDLFKDSTQ
jgi:hypothetical protein